jgi:aspartyl-tRNA(Asn)/glutamyl-tRNA(Gln) amidotransferase subunit B
MRSPEEAAAYLRELRATLASLDVSDVKMEEGSLRCDANVSLRPTGSEALGTKVEIKNMNSIRSLERALAFEIERQTKALDAGDPIVQETRHWDEDAGSTASMRSKEEAFDYRYFPEPDIPAMEPDPSWVDDIRASLPELPQARRDRYAQLGLPEDVLRVIASSPESAAFFDDAVDGGADPSIAANWITQDVAAIRNALGDFGKLAPQHVIDISLLTTNGTVSSTAAKQALEAVANTGEPVEEAIDRLGLRQVSDTGALGTLADEVLAEHPDVVQKFRDGKEGVIGFLVGQLMQKAAGAANPNVAQELLRERLQG